MCCLGMQGRSQFRNARTPCILRTSGLRRTSADSKIQEMRFKTIPQGAATSVWAATAAELDGQGGLYLEDCHIGEQAQPGQETQLEGGVEAYALDAQAAEKLWSLSEQLVGERFDL